MIQALLVHDWLEPNPAWWPLLYPADLLIGFYLSRVFAARLAAWNGSDSFRDLDSDDRGIVTTLAIAGGVFWAVGLAVWFGTKTLTGVGAAWERSVEQKSKRIIAKRQEEKPSLGRLAPLDQKEIA